MYDEQEKNNVMRDQHILDMLLTEVYVSGNVDERRIYSLYVNECLKRGQVVALDAKDAYDYIRNCVERYSDEINE